MISKDILTMKDPTLFSQQRPPSKIAISVITNTRVEESSAYNDRKTRKWSLCKSRCQFPAQDRPASPYVCLENHGFQIFCPYRAVFVTLPTSKDQYVN